MSTERRQSYRLKCNLPLRYSRGGQRVCSGYTVDISETGACLVLDEAASSPAQITLELESKVTLLARTVWAERLSDGKRLVGVTFEGMHFGQRLTVTNYLSELITRVA
ncbi:MAG: PilZ domain-containing protein [Candidatus Eremiobacteraeota bacterium]|nr:PilZ domain-containing protein [Candidatus Eremiobacteraeota bacterium]MCW5872568.1 PilZ domain-containing protein [Candidatus Eremiobacteraeota bacterium]